MIEKSGQTEGLDAGIGDIMKDLMTNVPGIDEAMAFAELMKMVSSEQYEYMVYDDNDDMIV
jgi:anion-transporting  ArsA/GET3 family ATPase